MIIIDKDNVKLKRNLSEINWSRKFTKFSKDDFYVYGGFIYCLYYDGKYPMISHAENPDDYDIIVGINRLPDNNNNNFIVYLANENDDGYYKVFDNEKDAMKVAKKLASKSTDVVKKEIKNWNIV